MNTETDTPFDKFFEAAEIRNIIPELLTMDQFKSSLLLAYTQGISDGLDDIAKSLNLFPGDVA